MLQRVALVRTDVSEERIAYVIRVKRVEELVFLRNVLRLLVDTNVPRSPILAILMMEAMCSSETSLQEPHGVKSQKTILFIVIVV
jgi:hypothetical protein